MHDLGRSFWIAASVFIVLPFLLFFLCVGLQLNLISPLSEHIEKLRGLSADANDWATFGSYLGGTLGPVLSGLAFFAIWKTYKLQLRQNELIKTQPAIEELHNIISQTSDRIDKILNIKHVRIIADSHELPFDTVFESLLYLGRLEDTDKPCITGDRELEKGIILRQLSLEITTLLSEVSFLCMTLKKHKEAGGYRDIAFLYTSRHHHFLYPLYLVGKLNEERTLGFFNFEEIYNVMDKKKEG